jgi:dTDP-4-dehydrorhamnose reductase
MDGIVVTGSSGLVGFRVMQQLCRTGLVWGFYHQRKPDVSYGNWVRVDLRDRSETHRVLDRLLPSTIIHCAAYSDPVYCEQHPEETNSLNFGGSLFVSEWASRKDCFLVHLSTDLVFDGHRGDYREEDDPHPISVYGWTKLAAELAVRRCESSHAVIRTSLVYGRSERGDRGADEKLASNWEQGLKTPLFVDEYRNPTAVGELASVIMEVVCRRMTGVLHVAGAECMSRFELGTKVASVLGYPESLLLPRKIEEVPCTPPRAPNTTLNIDKIRNLLDFPFATVETNLRLEWGLENQYSAT